MKRREGWNYDKKLFHNTYEDLIRGNECKEEKKKDAKSLEEKLVALCMEEDHAPE